jgi:hypothetical protein
MFEQQFVFVCPLYTEYQKWFGKKEAHDGRKYCKHCKFMVLMPAVGVQLCCSGTFFFFCYSIISFKV